MFIHAELMRLREAEYEQARRQIATAATLGPARSGCFVRFGRRAIEGVCGFRLRLAHHARSGVTFARDLAERVRLTLDPQNELAPRAPAVPSICVRCLAAVWWDDVAVWTAPQRCVCLRCHQPAIGAARLGSRLHAEIAAALDVVPPEGTRPGGR